MAGSRVGLLACQGGFEAHRRAFAALGVEAEEVRTPEQVTSIELLVIPGGESTTLTRAIARDGLEAPIREHLAAGRPVLGTCAGAIVLDRDHLGLLDIACERNAYGRQPASFEADLVIDGCGAEPCRAVFIRAPRIRECGPGVEVLARYDDDPVVVREGNVIVTTFHPELTDDQRLHALFLAMASEREPVG